MLVISKFAGIHEYAVSSTGFKFQMGLLGIGDPGRRLSATWALHGMHSIEFFPCLRVAEIHEIGHPRFLELLCLTVVKPQTLATGALIFPSQH